MFFFSQAKAALAYSRNEIIWVSQVGLNCPKLTLSMRVFGPCNSAHTFLHTYFCMGFPRQTNILTYIYISREISIEQPSVGLASLSQ